MAGWNFGTFQGGAKTFFCSVCGVSMNRDWSPDVIEMSPLGCITGFVLENETGTQCFLLNSNEECWWQSASLTSDRDRMLTAGTREMLWVEVTAVCRGSHESLGDFWWRKRQRIFQEVAYLTPSNAELNPNCHLRALLGTSHIHRVSRIRIKRGLIFFLFIVVV